MRQTLGRKRAIDMTGQRFGSLVAVGPVGSCSSGDIKWSFQCDCGDLFACNGYVVRSGKRAMCPTCTKKKLSEEGLTHGMANSPEYMTWTDMKTRCLNPNSTGYKNYGGRGISVCERWMNDFQSFLDDMGRKPSKDHSIDRIDHDGDYEPSNCRWATITEQANNKRTTVCINGTPIAEIARATGMKHSTLYYRAKLSKRGHPPDGPQVMTLEHDGIVDTVSGWAKRTGISATTITNRVKTYGWPVSKALTTGVKKCAAHSR